MAMTDPIAEMLTRIRDGIQSKATSIEMPSSKLKVEIAKILASEGFIAGYRVHDGQAKPTLLIELNTHGTSPRRVVLSGPFATKDDVDRVIEEEQALFGRVVRPKTDLYDTLLKTVQRSLDPIV